MLTAAPFNLAIIIATVVCSYYGFTKPSFADRWLFDVESIVKYRQYYRIVSSAFLHGNWMHLIFNMYSLYSFGGAVEGIFGPAQFLLIYFVSILGGNLLSLVLHRHHEYRALGASGGVCGIIFACIFLLPGSSVFMFPFPFAIPAHIFAVVFIVGSYLGLRGQLGNIGHDAHLGGAIIGLLVTTMMHPYIVRQNPVLYPLVMGLAAILFLSLYLYPLYSAQGGYKQIKGLWEKVKDHSQPNSQKDEEALNRLLDKVSKSGIGSLTRREKKRLKQISKRRKIY
jgi:membrane associated rhomboid family serine protease